MHGYSNGVVLQNEVFVRKEMNINMFLSVRSLITVYIHAEERQRLATITQRGFIV